MRDIRNRSIPDASSESVSRRARSGGPAKPHGRAAVVNGMNQRFSPGRTRAAPAWITNGLGVAAIALLFMATARCAQRPREFLDCAPGEECMLRIDHYELSEVPFPEGGDSIPIAIAVEIRGTGLLSVAQPLMVTVGDVPVRFLRIAEDERSARGLLLSEPEDGATVEVQLGEQARFRHPTPVQRSEIRRIR